MSPVSRSTERGLELMSLQAASSMQGALCPLPSASTEESFTDRTGSRKQLSVYLLTNLFLWGSRALVEGLQALSRPSPSSSLPALAAPSSVPAEPAGLGWPGDKV